MSAQQELIASLDALEASIPRHSVGSSAIVHPGVENLSEGLQKVFKTMSVLGPNIDVVEGNLPYPVIRGTRFKVEVNTLSREAYVVTRAGKLKVPAAVRVKKF